MSVFQEGYQLPSPAGVERVLVDEVGSMKVVLSCPVGVRDSNEVNVGCY